MRFPRKLCYLVRDKQTASPLIRDFSSIQDVQVVDDATLKIILCCFQYFEKVTI
jgi:hypothetical protein